MKIVAKKRTDLTRVSIKLGLMCAYLEIVNFFREKKNLKQNKDLMMKKLERPET